MNSYVRIWTALDSLVQMMRHVCFPKLDFFTIQLGILSIFSELTLTHTAILVMNVIAFSGILIFQVC